VAEREELPDEVFAAISKLRDQGNTSLQSGDFTSAYAYYYDAWKQLPEPANKWGAGLWLISAMGDAKFHLKEFSQSRELFQQAIDYYRGEGNPVVHMRAGQCALELADEEGAAQQLARAFSIAGKDIFSNEDVKYYEFLRERVAPPVIDGVAQWP